MPDRLILSNARLIDPEAGEIRPGGVILEDGLIAGFTDAAPEGAIDCRGKCLAPGIVDIGVKIGEPGERHKESYRTAGQAAAAGGVTTVVTRPDTTPVTDTPELLEFASRRAAEVAPVRVLPMAALTKGRDGREMTEIGFLRDAGAVAFTDADRPVRDPKVLLRAMQYARGLDALIIAHAQEPGLSHGACMTSGPFAAKQGLPSVSPMAERMQLERDLALVEMTGVRYHADQVTCAPGIAAIRRAKAQGLDVTAGTSVHHLTLNEFDVGDYRTFFKVKPPLRSESDRMETVQALADGVIDIVSSMHTPQDEESKRLPFEAAASGAVGLETLLPACLQLVHAGHIDLPHLFRALALNPARRLGLPVGRLAVGAPADLVLFDPDTPFILDRGTLRSKSKNTPYDGRRMQGRVLLTLAGGRVVFDRSAA
ncbi:amidohydrolase family protein [Rhodobacteraceae bacterium 2CG4]|uniref:Amidohydrolase family protein n=1 Tax=Halovulum marinum TaxID=2662447 RepID=A0A6L5Z4C4_9RHOB|nr:dihydroorotase [Halovulum marinum]MSU91307.1 amidohydrolase family protein [Halovulum marinum]